MDAADEVDGRAGVRVEQHPGLDDAVVAGLERDRLQIAREHVVACIATVAVEVLPGRPELRPRVAGHRRRRLDAELRELRLRQLQPPRSARSRARAGRKAEDRREGCEADDASHAP
jgi:hypothetical protein